jgi:dihydrofolate synthase/folylpolyglutamate synthase
MRKLSALLGMPQHRFASIHVVGTNGKSSVARMTAALLEAHGVSAGACVSPHAARWSERVLVHGEEIGAAEFAAAVERAAQAAEAVNRTLEEGEAVTQFELATAAAFVSLAAARVETAVVEAGLGGRLDATNTIPSRVTVLTTIGLDHTQWLGESEEEIAAEKLAVLRDQATLVLGRVSPAVAVLAERTARERGARLIVAPEDPGEEVELRAPGRFQRRNFALACAAAEAFLGGLDPGRVAAVAAGVEIPGRLERVADDPPAYLDAAHNPDAAAALAEALAEIAPTALRGRHLDRMANQMSTARRPVVACLALLRDKDARAIVRALAPAVTHVVCTRLPGFPADGHFAPAYGGQSAHRRGYGAQELAEVCAEAGVEAEAVEDFGRAIARGRAVAAEEGGILVVAGSHYALAPARAALAEPSGSSGLTVCDD